MDKPIIDKRTSQRADEFAQREYMYGSHEREALSKGYYCGYKDAEKDLALTWKDVAIIITIYEQGVEAGNISRYEDEDAPSLHEASEIILQIFNELISKSKQE